MKIYIWGTGVYGAKIINEHINIDDVEAFIDNDKNKKEFMGKKVVSPEYLKDNNYTCVIVATIYGREIYYQCKNMGIDINKFIFMFNNYILDDINKDYLLVEKVLGKKVADNLKQQGEVSVKTKHIIPNSHTFLNTDKFTDKFMSHKDYKDDYVRIKTFEMVANEINLAEIPGETAEVGVCMGDFAQYINYMFPDKRIYLFDTFEGFEKKEASSELKKGYCDESFIKMFNNVSIEAVMKKMSYPEKVIIKKGFFPQSLDGLEEKFAFVSLDVDFEESMLEGLRYFYPHLSDGGYIFIHDYNYCDELNLKGVRCAVDRYEAEIGEFLHRVPICDQGGTLVISK